MMEINKIANLLNLEHVKFLISIFKENNIEIRLVGGCIRDALLEREIKDIDTATTLEPQDVLSLLKENNIEYDCLLYTSPSPRDGLLSRMPSSA